MERKPTVACIYPQCWSQYQHIAPSFTALGEELGEAGRITLVRRTVESSDLDGVDMLVTVDDLEEAGDIAKQARLADTNKCR